MLKHTKQTALQIWICIFVSCIYEVDFESPPGPRPSWVVPYQFRVDALRFAPTRQQARVVRNMQQPEPRGLVLTFFLQSHHSVSYDQGPPGQGQAKQLNFEVWNRTFRKIIHLFVLLRAKSLIMPTEMMS